MRFNFENLEVWNISLKLIDACYKLAGKFPAREKFVLVSQLQRAVTSIALNIAEGSGRNSNKDFARFIYNAIGSLLEVKAILIIAGKRGFIAKEEYQNVYPLIEKLFFKLHAFRKSLFN